MIRCFSAFLGFSVIRRFPVIRPFSAFRPFSVILGFSALRRVSPPRPVARATCRTFGSEDVLKAEQLGAARLAGRCQTAELDPFADGRGRDAGLPGGERAGDQGGRPGGHRSASPVADARSHSPSAQV